MHQFIMWEKSWFSILWSSTRRITSETSSLGFVASAPTESTERKRTTVSFRIGLLSLTFCWCASPTIRTHQYYPLLGVLSRLHISWSEQKEEWGRLEVLFLISSQRTTLTGRQNSSNAGLTNVMYWAKTLSKSRPRSLMSRSTERPTETGNNLSKRHAGAVLQNNHEKEVKNKVWVRWLYKTCTVP